MHGILFEIFIFLAAACLVVPLTSRFKLGSVLGYFLAGVIIGPFVLGFINDPEKVKHFAEFGVVMMMFVIGLELEPSVLWRLRKAILGLGGLQVVLTTAILTALGVSLGFQWQASLAAGMALSLSSTALGLQMLSEKKMINTTVGETSFAVLLFQDIAVIPILIMIPLLVVHGESSVNLHGDTIISHLPGILQAIIVSGVIALVILGGRYFSHYLFRAIARTQLQEIFTALSLAVVVGITLLMQSVGVSPALGAFIAGVVLANSEYRRTLETDIKPFKGLLLGLFFISVGMGIDFRLFATLPGQIILAGAVLMLTKASILWVLGCNFKLQPMQNIGMALALRQGWRICICSFPICRRIVDF